MVKNHYETVREAFKDQASRFGEKGYALSNTEYLTWALNYIDAKQDDLVLDVAAGTGHLSRALAPLAKQIIAIDATEEMLAEGKKQAEKDNLSNIEFIQGFAEEIPYSDQTFDIVASRLAIHHFEDPLPPLQEMVRVCTSDGKVAIVDLLAPENATLAETYNHYERLRDPSHSRALSLTQMTELMESLGLNIAQSFTRDVEMDLERWLDLTKAPQDVRKVITEAIEQELDNQCETGMRPYIKDNRIKFWHRWVTLVGIK